MCGVVFFRWGGASGLGCASATGLARLGRVDSLWRIKFLLGDFALNL